MKRIIPLFIYTISLLIASSASGQTTIPCQNTGGVCNTVAQKNASPLPVVNNGNGTLGLIYNNSACGLNYVQGSVLIERRSANVTFPQVPFNTNGTGNPSSVTISGLPNCYVIEKAYVWITASYTSLTPPSPSLTITNPAAGANSYPFSLIGQDGDKCWGEVGSATYRADVTSNVTGNGIYNLNITGYGTAAKTSNEIDGATLLIIYRNTTSTYQGSLIIWDGIMSAGNFNLAPPLNISMTGFSACANSTLANSFMIVSDMQASLNGGIHNTTLNGATASYPNNFWCFDITNTNVTAGQNSASYGTDGFGVDCFSIALTGLYYQTTSCVTCTPLSTLNLNSNTIPTTCGVCTGSSTVNVNGGTAPYSYLWSGSGQTTQTATGLCAGTYVVTVTDNTGCNTSQNTVTVTSTGGLTANISSFTDTKCAGACNGTATAGYVGGNSPYIYAWSTSSQTTQTASGLCAGTYSVLITDINQCTSIATATIADPPVFTATTTNTSVSCNGGTNGTATASPTGGTGTYSYLWTSGATPQTTSSLSAGTYGVVVSDANGCTTISAGIITEPVAVTATYSVTGTTCNGGNNGSATVTPAGGTGAYSYLWTSGTTTQTASSLIAGTYNVVVADANGCTTTANVVVNEPPAITSSSSVTGVKCNGGNDGTAIITPAGGTGAYSYLWSNTATTSSISGLAAGTYSVFISDSNNCTSTASVTITEPAILTANIPLVNTICISQNAILNVNTLGGTPAFNYIWTTGQTGNPVSVNPTSTTTYSVLVTDLNGCTTSSSITLTVNPRITASSNVGAPVCAGQSVNIGATGAGGDGGPYSYSWTPANNLVCPACQNTSANPASTTSYTVFVSDNCGTPFDTSSVVVVINPVPIVSVSPSDTICNGGSTQLTCSTTTTFTCVWNPSTSLDDSNIPNPTATPTSTTTYTVTVVDSTGCPGTATVLVMVNPPPLADAGPDIEICMGESTLLLGMGGNNYSWFPSSGLDSTNIQNPVATPTSTTTYVVEVSTNSICMSDSDSVTVTVHLPPPIYAGADTSIMAGDTASLLTTNGGITWQWYPSAGLTCDTCESPYASPTKTTTYIVTTTDQYGCINSDTVVVKVDETITLFLPNAFTPLNNDFVNNIFYSYGTGIAQFELTIFNRWGEIIFYTTDPKLGWDGTFKGQMVLQDVYGYIATAKSLNGKSITKTGSITVVR